MNKRAMIMTIVVVLVAVVAAVSAVALQGSQTGAANIRGTASSTAAGVLPSASTTNSQGVVPSKSTAEHASTTAALLHGMHRTFNGTFSVFSRYVDKNGNVTCNPGGVGIWQTVYYFCSRTSAGNNEAEVYIDPGFLAYLKHESTAAAATSPDNPFSTSNGILAIRAEPSNSLIQNAVGSWAKYTSGMITTQFSFSQTYGYFEMRAKLPAGKGLWPAFWLLPTNKHWPPEVDAMEAFGGPNPNGKGGVTWIHYGSHALVAKQNCGGWYNTGINLTTSFNTYGVDIEPTGITYYFDGKAYARCPANSATDSPFYMIANLAVGGPGSWPGEPTSANVWPAHLYIQYIRAYQKNGR